MKLAANLQVPSDTCCASNEGNGQKVLVDTVRISSKLVHAVLDRSYKLVQCLEADFADIWMNQGIQLWHLTALEQGIQTTTKPLKSERVTIQPPNDQVLNCVHQGVAVDEGVLLVMWSLRSGLDNKLLR